MSKASPQMTKQQQLMQTSPLTDVPSIVSVEPSSEVKRVIEEKNLEIRYLQNELAKVRSEEGFLDLQGKSTPPKEGFKMRAGPLASAGKARLLHDDGDLDTSVLKVYMNNQLDLNEQEISYYEEVVNKLAEQLEKSMEECSTLREINEDLTGKLSTIDAAMYTISNFRDSFDSDCQILMHQVASFGKDCDERLDQSLARLEVISQTFGYANVDRSELLDLVERQRMDLMSMQSKLELEAQSALSLTAHAKSLESVLNTTTNVTQEEILQFNERLVEAEQRCRMLHRYHRFDMTKFTFIF